ncbi:MAG: MinD/ParA family protein [Nitrospirae bacterium]|nr:MinD/ParA family protein [Candidatus Troglogloeales bacterium]
MDQAETLRRAGSDRAESAIRVLSVTSGKGGMGKTNTVANLAVSFAKMGKRVLILDADLALGNIDVLFGVLPKFTLEDVLSGQKKLSDIIVEGPCGIQILPTGSGTDEMAELTSEQKIHLISDLDQLEKSFDIFLIDTAAGISSNVLYFNAAAQEIIILASSEPTSLTDAYAMMKVLSKRYQEKRFRLLVNMVHNEQEAKEVFRKLTLVTDRYLNITIDYIGFIPYDDYLKLAVSQQRAVVDIYPNAKCSQNFMRVAHQVLQWPIPTDPKGSVQFFWRKLLAGVVPLAGVAPFSAESA